MLANVNTACIYALVSPGLSDATRACGLNGLVGIGYTVRWAQRRVKRTN